MTASPQRSRAPELADPEPRERVAAIRGERLPAAHVPELDGIRAIAIWMVMVHHAFCGFPDYTTGRLPRVLYPLEFGWLGVDLFFVLSAFLITGILLDARDKPRYWRNFYLRRVIRIMPLYFVVVAVAAVFYRGYGSYFALATGFLANYAGPLGIRAPHGPGVLWSLAVEEQFYLLWPLVVLRSGRSRLLWVAGAIVVASPVLRGIWRASGGDALVMYSASWFRFDGLALGAFLAAWVRSPFTSPRRSLVLAAGLVALSLVVTLAALPFGVLTTRSVASGALRFTQVQLVFGAAVLLAFTLRGMWWTAPLRSGIARMSGNFSYCIYLIHLCLIDLWWWVETRFALRPSAVGYARWGLVRTLFVVTVSFALAALSRRYLEEPLLRLKRHLA